jgi:hypothetical protein
VHPGGCSEHQRCQNVVFLSISKQQQRCSHDALSMWHECHVASDGAAVNDRKDQHGIVVPVGGLCVVSLFLGVVIASLLPILLNVPRLEHEAAVLLIPGGILASFVASAEMVPDPMPLLAGNAIFYAMCFSGLCFALRRRLTANAVRLGTWVLGFAAVVLFALACVPRFDPLWPHGMGELQAREAKLRSLIRSDMTIDQVRAALQQESIPLNEETEDGAREVLRNRDTRIVASAGDRLVFSRFRTDAVQYPCGYDLQVVVLFAPDGKIKNRYVASLPICP